MYFQPEPVGPIKNMKHLEFSSRGLPLSASSSGDGRRRRKWKGIKRKGREDKKTSEQAASMKPDRFPVQKGNRPPPPPPLVRKNRKPNRTESPERSKTPCLASPSTAWTNSHNQNAELEYFPPVSLSSWYYTRAFFFSFPFLSRPTEPNCWGGWECTALYLRRDPEPGERTRYSFFCSFSCFVWVSNCFCCRFSLSEFRWVSQHSDAG